MIMRVENLHSGYGRIPVLDGISFEMAEGEAVGILGHNGMGKTTLLKALIGLLPTRKGHIVFQGEDIGAMPPDRRARRGLGYVPQGRGIFPRMSVHDNLRMGYAGHGNDEKGTIARVLADFPRLERLLDRIGGTLSGGEQQLLALARCLCGDPQLILLDEPTEGIQPSIVDEIADKLIALNRTRKLALVVDEQDIDFLTQLSHRILHLQKGRIIGTIDPGELMASPAAALALVG